MDWKKPIRQALFKLILNTFPEFHDLLYAISYTLENDPNRFKLTQEIFADSLATRRDPVTLLKESLGKSSITVSEAIEKYITRVKQTKDEFKSFIQIISDYLINKNIRHQMKMLSRYLRDNKNLYINLPDKIAEIILSSHPQLDLISTKCEIKKSNS